MVVTESLSGRIAVVNRPCTGQNVSGDSVFYFENRQGVLMGIADGLGHGPKAHDVSHGIKTFLEGHHHADILVLLNEIHENIRPCLGAALGLAYIHFEERKVSFVGVGNIAAYIIGERDKSFVSKDGTVGIRMHTPIFQEETLMPGDKIVLASDGVQARFYSQGDRASMKGGTASMVEYILSNFGKSHDDASCLVFGF